MATDWSKYGVVKSQATTTQPVSTGGVPAAPAKTSGTDFSKYGVVKSVEPASIPGTKVKAPLSNRIAEGLGFGGAVDTLSSLIARAGATEQEKQYIEKPTVKETLGAVGQIGSLALPVGGMARGATALFKAAGLGGKTAATLGNVGAGAATGYTQEVTGGLAEGKTLGEAAQPGALTAIGAGLPLVGPLAKVAGSTLAKTTKFGTAQATGLSPSTIETIVNNPKAITQAQTDELTRTSLASDVKNKIDARLNDLSETGKGYNKIRESAGVVNLDKDIVGETLSKYGLKVSPEGKILVSAESVPLKQGDISALENFVSQYGGQKTLSANAFLNTRKALDNLSSFEATKSDIADRIARDLRRQYDDIGKKQISGLADIDAKYSSEVGILKQIKKDYLTPSGELKDNAITKIANLGNLGRDKVMARLEKVVPDIKQRVQLLKALEDIEAAQGQKVGTYLRGGVGGFLASGGNPVVTVVSAIVSSPAVAVPILKAYGATKGVLRIKIMQTINKINRGLPLNKSDTKVIKDAVQDHATKFMAPGDILLNKLKKEKSFKNPVMGKITVAVKELLENKNLEIKDAFTHKDVGSIDIIYGKSGDKGYGISKIANKHPDVIEKLDAIIGSAKKVSELNGRVILETPDRYRVIIDKNFLDKPKNWLVNVYKLENGA